MKFEPATRKSVVPLIGLYGESGCGKTYSALLLARGIVGPEGKIGMIDTESGRGHLYADVLPGGYDVLSLESPFTPERYIEAINALHAGGFAVGIIDSGSHEWEGIGGVLDMASEREQKAGKPGLHCWKEPKMQHQKMMLRILGSKIPLIICLRAKFKSRQVKNAKGFSEIVKDNHVTPLQSDDFIFEMTAHAEVLQDHTIRLTKCSHPALRDCFPPDEKQPISTKHGEAIAAWAASGKATRPQSQPVSQPAHGTKTETKELKTRIWNRVKGHVGGDVKKFEAWALENEVLRADESLDTLSVERLREVWTVVENSFEALF